MIAGLDINLMPLENSLFHWCKSENKWTEAALVKVPSVMSRNCEMEYVVENGKDGWMCTTKEEWVNALEALVTDEKKKSGIDTICIRWKSAYDGGSQTKSGGIL